MRQLRAWWTGLRGRRRGLRQPVLTIDSAGLTVVAECYDDTEAASSVLGRASLWDPDRPAVLRHHLVLPEPSVDQARVLLAQDDWTLRSCDHTPPFGTDQEGVRLVALRVQALDALHCAQEASRMASLSQRLQGRALGWDALQQETGAGS